MSGFISILFLSEKKSRLNKSNLYQGLFLLSLSLLIADILLNYTGYMVKVIFVDNFSEPLNFAIGPLFYLFLRNSEKSKRDWIHFILFGFYLLYSIFYFIQSNEFKYNSYVWCYHPDWKYIESTVLYSADPLGIRNFINEATFIYFIAYISLSINLLFKKYNEIGKSLFTRAKNQLNLYRSYIIHFILIIILFVFVKAYFGRDLGDYFIASYTSLLLYIISYNVINKSVFINNKGKPALETKYSKSTLTENQKNEILNELTKLMKKEKYFKSNLASLEDISKRIRFTKHNVSQVINEKLDKNFFEYLAHYRIEEAKKLLLENQYHNTTIDEISEIVGYNSKSAFNNSFKKITGTTPANYRKTHQ
jgi:AraC-like DNA-binding protein